MFAVLSDYNQDATHEVSGTEVGVKFDCDNYPVLAVNVSKKHGKTIKRPAPITLN